VVTASLARRLWPGSEPLGQSLSAGSGRGAGKYQVVGVSRDFVFGSLSRPATGVVVTVRGGGFGNQPQFVIRTVSPAMLVEPIRQAVRGALPDVSMLQVMTGRDVVTRDMGQQQLGAWFFSGFGLTALLLGVGGVFGLVAYMAESRQREFAVRLALGATPRDLVRHGLTAALVPVTFGVAAGLIVAALVARLFTSLLTGLSALDPITYIAVAITMLGCATLAGLGASWRLRRMTPTDALRTD
jgi:predicted lysophospholipase L1 biosynthesis ABC-type transport system permease subunit